MKINKISLLVLILVWFVFPFSQLLGSESVPLNTTKGINSFLNAIGFKESSNRYDVVNPYGYLGRYQFSKVLIKNLGFNVTQSEFLSNKKLQDKVMLKLLRHNKKILKNTIKKHEGRVIKGIFITESGILAAAHLGGPTNVKKFLNNNIDFKDRNNTSLITYMVEFSGYNLNL